METVGLIFSPIYVGIFEKLMKTTLPYIIHLKKITDRRGNLSVIEQCADIPFEIKRTYWIYDVPGGEKKRSGHAYFQNEEFIVALTGSFDIVTDSGNKETIFSLNQADKGLYIPKMTWRKIENFSTNAVALVVASTPYNENDYICNRRTFKKLANEK